MSPTGMKTGPTSRAYSETCGIFIKLSIYVLSKVFLISVNFRFANLNGIQNTSSGWSGRSRTKISPTQILVVSVEIVS